MLARSQLSTTAIRDVKTKVFPRVSIIVWTYVFVFWFSVLIRFTKWDTADTDIIKSIPLVTNKVLKVPFSKSAVGQNLTLQISHTVGKSVFPNSVCVCSCVCVCFHVKLLPTQSGVCRKK